jgi:hypothetical protein
MKNQEITKENWAQVPELAAGLLISKYIMDAIDKAISVKCAYEDMLADFPDEGLPEELVRDMKKELDEAETFLKVAAASNETFRGISA